MRNMPELPVVVDPLVRQEDGWSDAEPIYQTHRGKRHNDDIVPPIIQTPEEALRWALEGNTP